MPLPPNQWEIIPDVVSNWTVADGSTRYAQYSDALVRYSDAFTPYIGKEIVITNEYQDEETPQPNTWEEL